MAGKMDLNLINDIHVLYFRLFHLKKGIAFEENTVSLPL